MKKIIIIIIIMSFTYAQNIENIFSNDTKESDISSVQLSQDIDLTIGVRLDQLTRFGGTTKSKGGALYGDS